MTTTRSNISTKFRPTTPFTALELDILEYVFSKINPTNPDFESVTFDVKNFLKVTEKKINDYGLIRKALRHIRKTELTVNELKYGSWFSFIIADPNESTFTVNIDPEAKLHLVDLEKEYVKYQTEIIFRLKSSYSKFFYPHIKSLAEKKYKKFKMTIPEIKEFFGIEDKYKQWDHLKNRVLEVMQKELQKKADIYFTYEAKKRNRSYYYLTFTIHRRKFNKQEKEMTLDPDNPIVDFMQKRYGFSEKAIANILRLIPKDKDVTDFTENIEAANNYITKKQQKKEKVDPQGVIKASIKGDWKTTKKPPTKQDKMNMQVPKSATKKETPKIVKPVKKEPPKLTKQENPELETKLKTILDFKFQDSIERFQELEFLFSDPKKGNTLEVHGVEFKIQWLKDNRFKNKFKNILKKITDELYEVYYYIIE